MHWLYDLPLALLCLLFVLGAVALAVGGVLLARRSGLTVSPEDNGTAAALHAFVGVVYAVALGLIVVSVQGDYGEVQQASMAEASAAGNMFRAIDGLEPASRAALHAQLGAYVVLVVRDEWPASAHGRESPRTWAAVDRLARAVHTFQPTSPAEERLLPEIMEQLDDMLDARRMRLFLGEQGIGAVTWTVILLGGIITVGFACFFHMERLRSQLLLTGLMGAMFGLMLFLIVAMDHPLWGKLSVQPDAFRSLITQYARMSAESPPAR
jgi:hypothetical protein